MHAQSIVRLAAALCLAVILSTGVALGARPKASGKKRPPAVVPPSKMGRVIQRLIEDSPAAKAAFWGVDAVDLSSGKALYSSNAERLFVPASNTKLFTTALALVRLGADYRFETRVIAAGMPDGDGRIRGNLVLAGGGDPTLSGRAYPYRAGAPHGNPLGAIEQLADAVVARGVRSVDGDIVGDDTAFVWAPYPDGWSQDDELWDYGAPVSALALNDGTLELEVRPGDGAGALAGASFVPPLEYYRLLNRVETRDSGSTDIHFDRPHGGREVMIWGAIVKSPDAVWRQTLAVDDPALYAAAALADALIRRGVRITGVPVARHFTAADAAGRDLETGPGAPPLDGVSLAARSSPPLVEIAQTVDKLSQNLHAEMLLREVARRRRQIGSREAGLKELNAFLTEAGLSENSWRFEDGSGLSRLGLVTPRAITTLLKHMYASPVRDQYRSLLPVGGQDGTLSARFAGRPEATRISAKTGSLSHVSALSGYGVSRNGRDVAFSVLVNNFNGSNQEIRKIMDTVALVLTGEPPPPPPRKARARRHRRRG
jgi:serine-type D-Ala-D-Ala carboxypeptidase/endopeptidase (penicillin-binding protein 4)